MQTDQQEVVLFSEPLWFRVYAFVVRLFKVFGDPYAKRLQMKEVQFLSPSVLTGEDQKTKGLAPGNALNAELSRRLENFNEGERQKVLELLPKVTVLSTSEKSVKALVSVLTYAEESWYKHGFLAVHPPVVKSLVEKLLISKLEDREARSPLEKMAAALNSLDSQHANVKAFVAGFPAHMPPSLAAQNYEARKNAFRWKPDMKEEEQIGGNCCSFLCSDVFAPFFEHLAEPERRALLKPLFAQAARYELCAGHRLKITPEQIAQTQWPAYQRDMLAGLAYQTHAYNLTELCFHPYADSALGDQILELNPPDRRELCRSDQERAEYDKSPDLFFDYFSSQLLHSTYPNKPMLVQWLLEAVFKISDTQRQRTFLKEASRFAEVLAVNFHRLPPKAMSSHPIESEQLLKMAIHLFDHRDQFTEANLKAIAHALATASDHFWLGPLDKLSAERREEVLHWLVTSVMQHPALAVERRQELVKNLCSYAGDYLAKIFTQLPQACQELFSLKQLLGLADQKGVEGQALEDLLKALARVFCQSDNSLEFDFSTFTDNAPLRKLFPHLGTGVQTRIIHLILEVGEAREYLLEGVKNARTEAWNLLGRTHILSRKLDSAEEALRISKTQNLNSIVALLNGLAEQLKAGAVANFTIKLHMQALLTPLFKEGRGVSLNSAPELNLSETFLSEFPLDGRLLDARWDAGADDYLLHRLVKTLRKKENSDHKHLLVCLADRVLNETKYFETEENQKMAVRFDEALNADQMQLIPWHRYSEKVMGDLISKLEAKTLLLLPREVLASYLKYVVKIEPRIALLNRFNDADALKALDLWWDTLERIDLNTPDIIGLSFPFGRMIDLTDNPKQIVALFGLVDLGYQFGDEAIDQIARAFENNPWKFWAGLIRDTVQQKLWLTEPRRTAYPMCAALAHWHQKREGVNISQLYKVVDKVVDKISKSDWKEVLKLLETPQSLENEIQRKVQNLRGTPAENCAALTRTLDDFIIFIPPFGVVKHLQDDWNSASWEHLTRVIVPQIYEELRRFNRKMNTFELDTIRGPSPRTLAKLWTEDQLFFTSLFYAIFDPKAREQLRQAASLISDAKVYQPFLEEMQAAIGAGGKACFVAPQYNQPALSDATLKIGEETIHAHRALLSLDPQLTPLFSSYDKTIIVPADRCAAVKSAIKQLYGAYSISEIYSEEGEKVLRAAFKQKPTLASLLETGAYSDITLDVEGKEIKAHKFILAAGLGYFAGLFNSGRADSSAPRIKLEECTYDEIKAVLDYVYTNEKPQFADKESETAFTQALDRFGALNSPH